MLVLNFNLYFVPLGVFLAFLKQYVIHVLLTDRNVNPEDQVSLRNLIKAVCRTVPAFSNKQACWY